MIPMRSPRIVLHANISRTTEDTINQVTALKRVTRRQAVERLIDIGNYVLMAQEAGDTVQIKHRRTGVTEVVRFQF